MAFRVGHIAMVMLSIGAFAMAQQHKQAPLEVPTVPLPVVADSVADSVVKPRWTPQRTAPRSVADLDTIPLDLRMPRNIALQVDLSLIHIPSPRDRQKSRMPSSA